MTLQSEVYEGSADDSILEVISLGIPESLNEVLKQKVDNM
jgi:hypothetical protein